MKRTVFAVLLVAFAAAGAFAQTERCYSNAGLKLGWTVTFVETGSKIAGKFVSESYDDPDASTTVAFKGTKSGSKLTIAFDGKTPYDAAPGPIVWTLAAGKLKVPMYGKNYQTNKYSSYLAVFDPCAE